MLTLGVASGDHHVCIGPDPSGPSQYDEEHDMSENLIPDNTFVEDGGENYEDLVNLSEDDE